jgi:tRNA threonylcarbamoyladenosine biosynthesis protein TsaB
MSSLLLLESSGEICSVALTQSGKIIQEKAILEPNAHSLYLAPFVADVLKSNGLTACQLDAVAISAGPGSYTGLRIGCSLAKGLCFGAGIPLIAVSTLKALAQLARIEYPSAKHIISLIDARRMDAYMGQYDEALRIHQDETFVTINSDIKLPNKHVAVVGSGAAKFMAELKLDKSDYNYVQSSLYARHMLIEANDLWESQTFVDLESYEPNYIKTVYVTKPKSKF